MIKINQSGFASLIIFLVILSLGVGGAYYFIQKPDTTKMVGIQQTPFYSAPPLILEQDNKLSDWLTYFNKTGLFSFKYPTDWKLNQSKDSSIDVIVSADYQYDEENRIEEVAKKGIKIIVSKKDNTVKLSEIKEGIVTEGTDTTSDKRILTVKQFTLDGRTALQYDYRSVQTPNLMGTVALFTIGDRDIYQIDTMYSSNDSKTIFEKILSTFKFIDNNNTPRDDGFLIEGLVMDNQLDCDVDSDCLLTIKMEESELKVTYHYGEYPHCLNDKIAGQIGNLKKGDKVQVFGKKVDSQTATVCDSDNYFVSKL